MTTNLQSLVRRLWIVLCLTMPAAHAANYTLTVVKAGPGGGTVTSSPKGIDCGSTCSDKVPPKKTVTLTATPAAGSVFEGWSGDCTGTAATCSVAMDGADRTVTATFAFPTLPLSVGKTGEGAIISSPAGIDCGAICSADFTLNSSVSLAATPAAGYKFAGWSGGACAGNVPTCTVSMSQAQSVTANFAPASHTLSVTQSGAGSGNVTSSPPGIDCGASCTASFDHGTPVTLTATPAAGSGFARWAGACTGKAPTCTLTVTQALGVDVEFAAPGTSTYFYDPKGNLTQTTDPLGRIRRQTYDTLDRLALVQEPHPSVVGATQGQIATAYDGQDRITGVTDPRALATGYTMDGLGNVLTQTSPDTGTTTFTYDAAGKLKTRTDARGKTASFSYDALNRPTGIAYGDQTVAYTWDACANGIGRLCRIDDGAGG
jgi:uncharacterized repeat protein (TIGR02543 family)